MMVPDIEFAVRSWARTAVAPSLLGGRVYFALPAGDLTLPALTVALISSDADPVDGIEYPRITFQVWGTNKKTASDVRRALVSAMVAIRSTMLDAETECYGAFNIFSTWVPDDEAKLARYVCDATFAVKAVSLA